MIVDHVFVDIFVHHAYLDRMPKRSIIAIAFWCAALIQFWHRVIYVGFLIIWNEEFFDKNSIYEKNLAMIVLQHSAVVHVRSVKKLVFLNAEVYFTKFHYSFLSLYFSSCTTRCLSTRYDNNYKSTSKKLLNLIDTYITNHLRDSFLFFFFASSFHIIINFEINRN